MPTLETNPRARDVVNTSQRPNMREEYLHEKLCLHQEGGWTMNFWMGYCCFTALASSLSLQSPLLEMLNFNKPGTTSNTYKNLFIPNNNKKNDTDQTIKYAENNKYCILKLHGSHTTLSALD